MRSRSIRTALLFVAALPLCAAKKPVTIDAIVNGTPRREGGSVVWAPNGLQFVVKRGGALSLYEVASGKQRPVIDLKKLEAGAEKPPEPAVFDWTNRRVSETDIQWFSDNRRLLVSASGDLFVVDTATGGFQQLTKTSEAERDPKLAPDNHAVSFRRGPNLFVIDLASKAVTQLTTNGSDTLLNGELDWVYPEELDLNTAHWWSPDSRSIAYLQFDVSREPVFPEVSLLSHHGVLEPERFPQPGDPNADVHLGVVSAAGGETRWMNVGEPRDHLLARVAWLPSGKEIAAERLNRVQNQLEVRVADISSGSSRVLLHEEDPAWINVHGDLQFLKDGRLLWTSERTGFRHMYLYGRDGTVERQLTSGEWEVDEINSVDEEHGRVFYTSTEVSPLERQLYSVSLDGANKQRLTNGEGVHSASFSPTCDAYLDRYSGFKSPPTQTLFHSDGKEIRVYQPPDRKDADEYEILPTEIVTVKSSDGTALYARMIKPANFQPGQKYPAVVMVYGGPGVQSIQSRWQGLSWDQVLAHKGFVIWQLDNRGSTGRGHKFESVIYHDMGAHELEDQKAGIAHLIALGFVDPQRIGLYGWSYGGYMTLYTVTHAPGLIKAAIAGAPVTNWRNYDSIYTERYMGLPEQDEQAYRTTSPLDKVADLQSKLLIAHNFEDDNVHFLNTMQMAEALERANKQFFMIVYPQRSHGVNGPLRRQLLEETTAFFESNLK